MDSQEKIQLESIVFKDKLEKADAIVCLEGDGQERTEKALEILRQGFAPIIIVSGGHDNPPFSIVAPEMADYLIKAGVPKEKIIIEPNSQNTREQAQESMKIIKEKEWGKIILVASYFHQLRAYMTFLKAMEDLKMKIVIINIPTGEPLANVKKLLKEDFQKIEEYEKKGHVISFSKLLEYQKWKEKQR